ncbi:TIGR04283 family arsenosugar biosynthesis glycosyltransferase [Aromatoleum anaerobium]|uniref:Glycosyltransferase n=1 Tax=Aromatoleum anaerobium TaxID=182180 RepID=A0ABX1PL19_9RHOO|nr:TIGR04283 family arsenosugar biosynthesis glycosyltransferase [Aromatoleum anaerobium]MCK0506911.1 TIGR04283 family arsenosugar biosynthesis glycosyltransferase [Aromatoleum anaerobium]
MKLSVVIPVLNEAGNLPGLLARLAPLRARGTEIIVVDGGSSDGSAGIAEHAGVVTLRSPAGRACQMNAGADRATGDALLFLHADTTLPPSADRIVAAALQGSHAWGRFDVRIDGRSPMLRVVAAMMNLRSRLTGIATGDQAIFVTRQAFDAVGRFAPLPLMEDIELSRRLKAISPPACVRQRVRTSGRRWETRGVWRTILLMWRLRWAWWRGVPAERLAERYR